MPGLIPIPGSDLSFRVVVDQLDQGWSNRTFPHLLPERKLYIADNVSFSRDGLVSKRPGNVAYGGGSGATGSGVEALAMTRFYPMGSAPQLLVQSGGVLYKGNDSTGAFTSVGTGLSTTQGATFAQVYDPDMSSGAAIALVICDGSRVPYLYDGTNFVPVTTGSSGGVQYLPNGNTGSPIKPLYVCNWKYNLVYAGDPTEPTALYISDALRPERFDGYGLIDSSGTPYTPYFPGGRDGSMGVITGMGVVGQFLVIFFTAGIVVGYNTGTYGAYEFEFFVLSTTTGCVAPRSIVCFEGFIIFFGGDRFYATDGNTIVPLPDEIPSVYGNDYQSGFPSEMVTKNTVIGLRHSGQYWASYDTIGQGKQTSVAVFDLQAGSGWTYGAPSGGAWARWPSGMPISCGVECRGPGDSQFPMFWGSSQADLIAQHDTGVYGDFGNPISVEVRCKAFFLDKPIWPKDVQALYVLAAFPFPFGSGAGGYTDAVQPYVIMDLGESLGNILYFSAQSQGVQYGGGVHYGQVQYGIGGSILTAVGKSYISQDAKGVVVQPGLTERSTNPFNLIGFVVEVIMDEPAP